MAGRGSVGATGADDLNSEATMEEEVSLVVGSATVEFKGEVLVISIFLLFRNRIYH